MLKPASALIALCASLALAAPAAADSIAYVKNGDVFLATPDGSRQQQVTTTGGYHYVSQADDGTMAALVSGERIQKLSRTGEVLAEFATYVSDGAPQAGPVTQFGGPFNPEISRDGKLIAYEWMNASYYNNAGCSGASVPPCYVLKSAQGVGITHADRFTGFEEFGLLTGWIGPYWMSGARLLRSGANVSPNEDAVINRIGPGKADDDMKRWFWDDNGASGVEEVEISRDEKVAAGVAGYYSDSLRIYRVLGDPMTAPAQKLGPFEENPQAVEPCIAGKNESGRIENLSFAPDRRALAYGAAEGIRIVDVPDISGGCGPKPTSDTLVIPGGKHPHWGPADIPPASAYDRRQQPDCCAPPPPEPGKVALTAAAAKLRGALARGIKVALTTPAGGYATATGRVGGRKVATGAKQVLGAGPAALTLRFTKAGKRALGRKRSARMTVTVTFTPDGGAAQTASVVMLLKR